MPIPGVAWLAAATVFSSALQYDAARRQRKAMQNMPKPPPPPTVTTPSRGVTPAPTSPVASPQQLEPRSFSRRRGHSRNRRVGRGNRNELALG